MQPRKYNFYGVYGLSAKQLQEHEALYHGYVRQLNTIRKRLDYEGIEKNANAVYSPMRSLKLGESYALNGVKLHQLYFENLGGASRKPYDDTKKKLYEDFGSYEAFIKRLKDVGMAMRGWAVLIWDGSDERLRIIGQDAHDVGSTIMTVPLLVMDVYEHAYMIDYGIDKAAYIDVFIRNINWDVVNMRYLRVSI